MPCLRRGIFSAGLTRAATRYLTDANAMRAALDKLKMPWMPCVGEMDVVSGTRMAGCSGCRRRGIV